jgi:hypothetical protein
LQEVDDCHAVVGGDEDLLGILSNADLFASGSKMILFACFDIFHQIWIITEDGRRQ